MVLNKILKSDKKALTDQGNIQIYHKISETLSFEFHVKKKIL